MKNPIISSFWLALVVCFVMAQGCKPRGQHTAGLFDEETSGQKGSFPIWEYDAGPDRASDMGRSLIDLHAAIPYFPGLSYAVYGDQMFRPAYGPIPWRMMQKENSVQILFIGQDGTHIAEAAGRPATAGFGGRAQDLAAYFGVSSSAAFINTYAFTIRWQYGAFDNPVVTTKDGKTQISYASFTGNPVWLITQDQQSPMVKWRNNLIEWIIRNNRRSLKLIVLFGGAARDAAGAFIESKGGHVGTRYTAEQIASLQLKVPEYTFEGAGSNKQTAVPITPEGKDLYAAFAGQRVNYTDEAAVTKLHNDFQKAFNEHPDQWLSKMAFSKGGLSGSGIVHPAQLGGYDIARQLKIGNETGTLSLKGLKISDDYTVDHDILVTQLPHPTALSMMSKDQASQAVAKGLSGFKKYVDQGWKVEPETAGGFKNSFAEGKAFEYGRGDMGTEYYDFGAPNSRMVNVSTASRAKANVIVFGTRDKVRFDSTTLNTMTRAQPSQMPPANELWTARPFNTNNTFDPGSQNRRYTFDPGPGPEMAKIMKTNLPPDPGFQKKHAVNGDFGHYRGTFKNPTVVILADPDGDDDLITARALTGSRGQYLHALMEGLNVGDNYLVIKTAPYSNYGAGQTQGTGAEDWTSIIELTKGYREAVLKKVFETAHPKLVLTDGPWAKQEFARIFPTSPAPVVSIQRGDQKDSGIVEALEAIKHVAGFEQASFSGKMADIPRSHLSYYARVWEGTSGDRVITAKDSRYMGVAFAEVAPEWSYAQKYQMVDSDIQGCAALIQTELTNKTRLGGESIADYYQRIDSSQTIDPGSYCQRKSQGRIQGGSNSEGGETSSSSALDDINGMELDPDESVLQPDW